MVEGVGKRGKCCPDGMGDREALVESGGGVEMGGSGIRGDGYAAEDVDVVKEVKGGMFLTGEEGNRRQGVPCS